MQDELILQDCWLVPTYIIEKYVEYHLLAP